MCIVIRLFFFFIRLAWVSQCWNMLSMIYKTVRDTHQYIAIYTSAIQNKQARTHSGAHIDICLRTTYKRYLLHTPCDVMIFIYSVESIPNEEEEERMEWKKKRTQIQRHISEACERNNWVISSENQQQNEEEQKQQHTQKTSTKSDWMKPKADSSGVMIHIFIWELFLALHSIVRHSSNIQIGWLHKNYHTIVCVLRNVTFGWCFYFSVVVVVASFLFFISKHTLYWTTNSCPREEKFSSEINLAWKQQRTT